MNDDALPSDPEIEAFASRVARYFNMSEQVSPETIAANKSLFDLRQVDELVAEMLDDAVGVRSTDHDVPLQYVSAETSIVVSVSPGVVDVTVSPPDAGEVLLEVGGETIVIELDAAGGGSVRAEGVARIRVHRAEQVSIVTDPFMIDPAARS